MELLNKDQIKSLTSIISSKITSDIKEHNKEIERSEEYQAALKQLETSPAYLEVELFLANLEGQLSDKRIICIKDTLESHVKWDFYDSIAKSFGMIDTGNIDMWEIDKELSARLSLTEVSNYDDLVNNLVAIIKNKYQIYA